MLLLLFLLGLSLGAVCPSEDPPLQLQRGDCPTSWFSFSGRCYKYVGTAMNWADAEIHCVSLDANLVSIHSEEEQMFVKTLIKNFDPAEGRTWIGLSDNHKEGTWMWSDGSRVDFTYWAKGQPNYYDRRQRCVETNFSYKKWNDHFCSYNVPFVCASRLSCP
ncbi:galactose-specific lectin nattectin-like [Pungitius pungitius]|uniref:galactose-specific lectin nattectin-like n=1 Tax=Pungitius pungitius TaxID=134920 RepID=UPI001887C941|nr:galactose-specific lectin nattectin-like [Pungitius pungitius]